MLFTNLKHLLKLKWDYLIILDACRYDYFVKVYHEFLRGTLRKALSPATKTEKWVKAIFKKRYEDIVYISANPIISSKITVWGFEAKKHFYKVLDVWYWGWSEEWGSVPPWEVNDAVLEVFREFPGKRVIIHYMQPHAPYAPTAYLFKNYKIEDPFTLVRLREPFTKDTFRRQKALRLLSTMQKSISHLLPKWIPRQSLLWKLRKVLNIPPKSPEELFYRSFSVREIQLMYELNLRYVLKYVNELVKDLLKLDENLKIVITSDHGELLGERGEIGHVVGHNLPKRYELKLREVPWFEVLEPVENVTKWYGDDPHALKFAKYFEIAERELRAKKTLKIRIRKVRRKLMNR